MPSGTLRPEGRIVPSEFRRPLLKLFVDHSQGVLRCLSVVVTLAAWEVYGRGVDPIFLSYPSAIAEAAVELIGSGELQTAFFASARYLVAGLVLAIIFGTLLGLLMGRYRTLDALLDIQINALYSTPNLALIPLLILWFGMGDAAKVVLIFLAGFFPVIINTYSGVRNIGRGLVEVVLAEGANDFQTFTKIILPASLPFVMTGIRLAMGRAIVGMVGAELFTATSGLGGAIMQYGNSFATSKLFVIIIALAVLGIVLTEIVKRLEQRFAAWKVTERAS